MRMKRRDVLAVAVVGAGALIAPRAEAALVGIDFKFIWHDVLPPEARNLIKNALAKAAQAIGRATGISTEASVSAGRLGGPNASIAVSVRKRADGHLTFGAQVTHAGQTGPAHSGTAPHHAHPHMTAHCNTIVGKAHAWLAARGM